MHVRTYRAESIQDALQMARRELGPEAFVWQTRQVRAGGMAGLISGRTCVEVTASLDLPEMVPGRSTRRPSDYGIDLTEMG